MAKGFRATLYVQEVIYDTFKLFLSVKVIYKFYVVQSMVPSTRNAREALFYWGY